LQKLEELQRHVAAMHASCDEAETQLRLTNEASTMLLERAGSLSEERLVHCALFTRVLTTPKAGSGKQEINCYFVSEPLHLE
jgi:hypothetical protein